MMPYDAGAPDFNRCAGPDPAAAGRGLRDCANSLVSNIFPGGHAKWPVAMTPDEIRIVDALARCSFVPGTTHKRLVRQLAGRECKRPLTDSQRAYLWAIAWSWRRQLPADLVALARRYSGGIGIRGSEINSEAYRQHVAEATASSFDTAAAVPARGARRPNADEQAGDWGDDESPRLW